MGEASIHPPQDSRSIILAHAKAHDTLGSADANLIRVTPPRSLPEVEQWYLEKQGSQHVTDNYFVYHHKAYSAGADGDLRRFSKDYDLPGRNLNADAYLALLRVFSLPRDVNVVDAEFMSNYREELKRFPTVRPPTLKAEADGGRALTFFVTAIVPFRPERWVAYFGTDSDVRIEQPYD